MELDKKSDTSLAAANQLLTSWRDTYATQSVHDLYYSVLQFMKYILANAKIDKITYAQQLEEGGDNSHMYIRDKILLKLDFNQTDKRIFKEDLRNLKRARVEADYSVGTFTVDEALDFKSMAERLLALLKKVSNDKINH